MIRSSNYLICDHSETIQFVSTQHPKRGRRGAALNVNLYPHDDAMGLNDHHLRVVREAERRVIVATVTSRRRQDRWSPISITRVRT